MKSSTLPSQPRVLEQNSPEARHFGVPGTSTCACASQGQGGASKAATARANRKERVASGPTIPRESDAVSRVRFVRGMRRETREPSCPSGTDVLLCYGSFGNCITSAVSSLKTTWPLGLYKRIVYPVWVLLGLTNDGQKSPLTYSSCTGKPAEKKKKKNIYIYIYIIFSKIPLLPISKPSDSRRPHDATSGFKYLQSMPLAEQEYVWRTPINRVLWARRIQQGGLDTMMEGSTPKPSG